MAATTEQNVLLVLILVAATAELYFIVRAVSEYRAARLYQMLLDELRRLQRP